jgi:hypothetical protein
LILHEALAAGLVSIYFNAVVEVVEDCGGVVVTERNLRLAPCRYLALSTTPAMSSWPEPDYSYPVVPFY